MRILVIEDDVRKAEAVADLLKDMGGRHEVCLEQSYQTGLKKALSWCPDLIILDMSLPNYDSVPGGRTGKQRPLGGVDLMRKLRRRQTSVRAIVLTQLDHFGDNGQEYDFETLEAICFEEFPEVFLGSIYFAQSSTTWMGELLTVIRQQE